MVIRNIYDTIKTIVHQKLTNTDMYVNWHSYSPMQWKKTNAVLIQRATRICSYKKLQDDELNIIKHSL